MEVQWELLFFSLFVAVGMGSFAFVAVTEVRGELESVRLPGVFTSLFALGLGSLASFFHLGHPERIFHMLGNMRSGISQEFISTAVIITVVIIYAFMLMKKDSDGVKRRRLAIVGIVLSCLVVLSTGKIYLQGARPAWNTLVIPFLYLSTAIPLGLFTMSIWVSIKSEDEEVAKNISKWLLFGQVMFGFMVLAYVLHLAGAPHPDPTRSAARLIAGDLAAYFWGFVVLIGIAVPMFMTIKKVLAKQPSISLPFALAGLACTLVGAGAIRALQYLLGTSVHQFLVG
jgi:anaerobic dimethyl sulfoxide reductase subunit C (anchor subunit)